MTRVVLAAVIFTAMTATGEKKQPPDVNQTHVNQMHEEGCVEPGVEAGCLVVKDMKDGKLYSILVKGLRPEIGEGIEFTGARHEGPTSCMQGIAVDVIKWTQKKSLKCSRDDKLKVHSLRR